MSHKKGSDEQLLNDYLNLRLPVNDIVEKYGFASHSCVCRRLHNLGVSPRENFLVNVPLTNQINQLIEGSLLGDAYARKKGRGAYVKFAHSFKQDDYVLFKHTLLQPFSLPIHHYKGATGGKPFITSEFVTPILPQFISFVDRFYPRGVKIIPRDLQLTPISLAVWFMDDGNGDPKWNRVRFATCSYSEEDNQFLLFLLNTTFDLSGSVVWCDGYRYIVLSSKSFSRFVSIVGDYIIPSMRYKINC